MTPVVFRVDYDARYDAYRLRVQTGDGYNEFLFRQDAFEVLRRALLDAGACRTQSKPH